MLVVVKLFTDSDGSTREIVTCEFDTRGDRLMIGRGDYMYDIREVDYLDGDVDKLSDWCDEMGMLIIDPCSFVMVFEGHPIYKEGDKVHFYWDGVYLTNLSEGWFSTFGEDGDVQEGYAEGLSGKLH